MENKITEPLLMQEQNGAFNNDSFICKKILELKKEWKITHAIELGTCLGYSAEWFAKNFDKVDTIEISQEYLNIALQNRLNRCANVDAHLGSTINILPHILSDIDKKETVLIFQDSHWGPHWPALEELKIIKQSGLKPILVIHDFYIPEYENSLGYDSFEGIPLSLNYIQDSLKAIYDGNFSIEYNTPETSTGAKRGVAYITPFIESEFDFNFEINKKVIDWSKVEPGFCFKINTGEQMIVKLINKKKDYFELVLVDSIGEILTCTNKEIDESIGI